MFVAQKAEPPEPSLKDIKNRMFSEKIAEALESDEEFDWAELSKTPAWIDRVKQTKSQYHPITEEMFNQWTAEAVAEFEQMEATREAWQEKQSAAAPPKDPFPPRSLQGMIQTGKQLLVKAVTNKITPAEKKIVSRFSTRKRVHTHDHCSLFLFFILLSNFSNLCLAFSLFNPLSCLFCVMIVLQFHKALTEDFDAPDVDDPQIDNIYAADESSIYCNKRTAASTFKGAQRTQLKTAIAALCPVYPTNKTPHDHFAREAEEAEEESDAICNLRHWTPGSLPLRVIQTIQATLYEVNSSFSSFFLLLQALRCRASFVLLCNLLCCNILTHSFTVLVCVCCLSTEI